MDKKKQLNEPARMTLDELFRKTFSNLLATLMDTLHIFEEPSSVKPPGDITTDAPPPSPEEK